MSFYKISLHEKGMKPLSVLSGEEEKVLILPVQREQKADEERIYEN